MDYRDRISRKDRRHKRFPWIALIIVLAAIGVGAVLLVSRERPAPPRPVPVVTAKPAIPPDFRSTAETLIIRCCRSFGLSDSCQLDLTSGQRSSLNYQSYRQSWPSELPFLLFAQRLNDAANQLNLQCDCTESAKQGWLDCSVKAGDSTGARVLLNASKETNLAGREVAVVLDNLGAVSGDELRKLIRSGVIFSYFAMPDFYPTGEMARLFARGSVTAILRFSNGENRRGSRMTFKKPMVKDAMTRHPGAKSFIFDESSADDQAFTRNIVSEARRAKLPYLCLSDAPGDIDRAASSSGIPMIKIHWSINDYAPNPSADPNPIKDLFGRTKFDLYRMLLSEDSPRQIVVYLDASRFDINSLIALKEMLSGIGVKFRPYMKLTQKIDTL